MTSVFFYEMLLHPQVLKRVLGHDGEHLQVAPAILLEYTRHRVRDCDYPAILSSSVSQSWFKSELSAEQRSVQGTLVAGLSKKDLVLIDLFKGEEYNRALVAVHPCTPFMDTLNGVATVVLQESAPQTQALLPAISAYAYIWTNGFDSLLPEFWSFDEFIKEKLWRWVGNGCLNNEDYSLVDGQKALSINSSSSTTSNSSDQLAISDPLPPFGRTLRAQFFFEDHINLNHGSFGSLPRPVAEACQKLEVEVEARPDLFLRRTYFKRLRDVRERLAQLVHADINEIVMVANATLGINTILRNIEWSRGDVIIRFSTTYDAVSLTADYIRDCSPHLQILTIPLTFPTTHANIVSSFKEYIQTIRRPADAKVVAIIDSISSNPGCLLPWQELVHACREAGIISIVDAAHSIGQELNINLSQVQPDFWVSNCHKWLYTKRSCAVLYVPSRNQHLIKSSIPTSWNYVPADQSGPPPLTPNKFVAQFDGNGTIDVIPFLSVLPALKFREMLGGEERINQYCRDLAIKGGRRLAQLLGTEVFPEELTSNMTNIRLPLLIPEEFPTETLVKMRREMEDKLLHEWDCFAAVFVHDGKWWTRCSAQIYNDLIDFEYLAKALKVISEEMSKKYLD